MTDRDRMLDMVWIGFWIRLFQLMNPFLSLWRFRTERAWTSSEEQLPKNINSGPPLTTGQVLLHD